MTDINDIKETGMHLIKDLRLVPFANTPDLAGQFCKDGDYIYYREKIKSKWSDWQAFKRVNND